jgi:outer membrane protein TolC
MRTVKVGILLVCLAACALLAWSVASAQTSVGTLYPEQRRIMSRTPTQLSRHALARVSGLDTVARPMDKPPLYISLDEAIHTSLRNLAAVRVLAGNTAVASGRTIYDPGITNTTIDQQQARFDPTANIVNSWNQVAVPGAIFDPLDPSRASILGSQTRNFTTTSTLSKLNALGGTTTFGATAVPQNVTPRGALNPLTRSNLVLGYTQPLLQGAGRSANTAQIDVSRINTERAFYQYKDTLLEHVRGVVEAYWNLVFSRIDVWVRLRQVDQTKVALEIAESRMNAQIANIGDVLQARTTLANFQAQLIASQANRIQREAALRNIMGLPPADDRELIPTSPLKTDRYDYDWFKLCELAGQFRPDLIDLQLALEADQRLVDLADNIALPQLNAQALYRWSGLSGQQPNGTNLATGYSQFNDWTAGLAFAMPLGLRQARAGLRAAELTVMRDRVNLDQGLHQAVHLLATTVRGIDQTYEQYLAFIEARNAARLNLRRQVSLYRNGQSIYLNVLLAITDWGNSISSEANSLTNYNVQLANLERQTGTILETHAVSFYEEQFGGIGPWGRLAEPENYPAALRPTISDSPAAAGDKPSDDQFGLEDPPPSQINEPLPDLPYGDALPNDRRNLRDPLPDLLDREGGSPPLEGGSTMPENENSDVVPIPEEPASGKPSSGAAPQSRGSVRPKANTTVGHAQVGRDRVAAPPSMVMSASARDEPRFEAFDPEATPARRRVTPRRPQPPVSESEPPSPPERTRRQRRR